MGRIPSLLSADTEGGGAEEAFGRVLLAARSETEGALFLARVEAPIKADARTREALLLSAPEALRHLWGVDVEVRGVDLLQRHDEKTLQLKGRVRLAGGIRQLRVVALPRGDHHLLLVMTWPASEGDALEAEAEAERVVLTLQEVAPAAVSAVGSNWTAAWLLGAASASLLGLGIAFVRRRRRGLS